MLMLRERAGADPRAVTPVASGSTAAAPLLLLAAALLLRAPGFLGAVIDPDEGLYIVQAAAWLDGRWPYVAVWDMHPPGAPALMALVHAFIADPVMAMRVTGVLAVTATACGLRAIARLVGAGPRTALAAGLLYVAYSTVQGGLATNTEILFAPFVALVAWLLLRETTRAATPRAGIVLAAGLAAGIALWIKQINALESSALWLTLIAVARPRVARIAALAGVFAFGAGLPTLGMGAGYWLAGGFDPWIQGNLWALVGYGDVPGEWPGWRRGVVPALPHLMPLVLAAAGLLAADRVLRRRVRLLLPWLAAGVMSVIAPLKFYDHYFLILLPPLCLLAALGLSALASLVLRAEFRRAGFAAGIALLAALPVTDMFVPRLAFGLGLRHDPARGVAAVVESALRPGEALFVANWHPVVYALTGQAPPTRLAFPGHLAGNFAHVTGVDPEAELARVLALPPGVIVVAPSQWPGVRPVAQAALEAALERDYELVGEVPDRDGPVQVWRRR